MRIPSGPLGPPVAGADIQREARLTAALTWFGWTTEPEFWRRYYEDPWVFNLANAVEQLITALGARNTEAEKAWIEENNELHADLRALQSAVWRIVSDVDADHIATTEGGDRTMLTDVEAEAVRIALIEGSGQGGAERTE